MTPHPHLKRSTLFNIKGSRKKSDQKLRPKPPSPSLKWILTNLFLSPQFCALNEQDFLATAAKKIFFMSGPIPRNPA